MNTLKNMIKISEGFSYSVNVKHDMNDIGKLVSYIPTDKTIDIIKSYCLNNSGSYIIVGSYGTGKSHLMALLANISGGRYKKSNYQKLIEKVVYKDKRTGELLQQKIHDNNKKLVIFPSHLAKDFEQAILLGINEALQREEITDIFIDSYFKSIKSKLDEWESKYARTYDKFFDILETEHHIKRQNFINGINDFEKDYFKIFTQIFPRVTSGSTFSPYGEIDICNTLIELYEALEERGYDGIDIIFDEFGSFLEDNIENIVIKQVQDLAELANNGGIKLSFYAVVHKDFSQYSERVSEIAVIEWRKVEGRFKRFDIYQDPSDVYQLISRVIIKDQALWENFYTKNKQKFVNLEKKILMLPTFHDLTPGIVNEYIIKGCYPIGPLSAFALYKLSDMLAQNQRTLFTFLSIDEQGACLDFIQNPDGMWITGDVIFDYFELLMWGESKESNTYKVWKNTKTALNKIDIKDNIKKKILKVIGLIYVINDFERLKPDMNTIKLFLPGYEDKIEGQIKQLILEKVLFYRKSIDIYQFFEGSETNIEVHIEDYILKNDIDIIEVLNREFLPVPLLPRRYNENFKINRCFSNRFYASDVITADVVEEDLKDLDTEGRIYYLIPSNEENIHSFLNRTNEFKNKSNVIFILPCELIDIQYDIKRFKAIRELQTDQEFLNNDEFIQEELLLHEEDMAGVINNKLSIILNNNYHEAHVVIEGKIRDDIKNRFSLQQEASRLMKKNYNKTPKINNEMVNKNKMTSTMKRVVEDVINELWEGNTDKDLGFNEFNAQHTVLRTILLNTDILAVKNGKLVDNRKNLSADNPLKEIFSEIENFLLDCRTKEKNFICLYNRLKSPPYGLKDGVISILLGIALKDVLGGLYIRKGGYYQDTEGKLLTNMIKGAEEYFISIDIWEEEREHYISSLEQLFNDFLNRDHSRKNRLSALYKAMKKYYIILPKITRSSERISRGAKNFRAILERDFVDYRKLYFKTLKGNDNYNGALTKIEKAKEELDAFREYFENDLAKEISRIFSRGHKSLEEAIANWYTHLNPAVLNHVFDLRTNLFLKYLSKPDDNFLEGLVKTMTGFELDYMTDEIAKELVKEITEAKASLEKLDQVAIEEDLTGDVKITLQLDAGSKTRFFNRVELNFLGTTLKNKIEKDIENMGLSLKGDEIRTILIELLEKYI